MLVPMGDFSANSEINSIQVFGPAIRSKVAISIVIPTFRRQKLLQDAVFSALEQDGFDDYEIIIIDNDPEGELPIWIDEISNSSIFPNLYYFKNEKNLGMTGNWNRGIELALGDWISFLHDDDWLSPKFLKQMASAIPADAKAIACRADRGELPYKRTHVFKSYLHFQHVIEVSPCRIIAGNLVDAPGVIYKKSELVKLGGYSDLYFPSADYHLNAILVLSGGVYLLSETLAYYRTSDSLTFKGGTLEAIMFQSQRVRRFILGKNNQLSTRLNFINSSLWWYRLGVGRKFDVKNAFNLDPSLRYLSRVPGLHYLLRIISRILLTWK